MEYEEYKIITMDFTDVINTCRMRLSDAGYFDGHVDYREVLEHTVDIVLLGSTYERFTVDLLKESLEHNKMPTDFYLELSKEFRVNIAKKFDQFVDFYTNDIHITLEWQPGDNVADVTIFTSVENSVTFDAPSSMNVYEQ